MVIPICLIKNNVKIYTQIIISFFYFFVKCDQYMLIVKFTHICIV